MTWRDLVITLIATALVGAFVLALAIIVSL
jgi:hypothetical protein